MEVLFLIVGIVVGGVIAIIFATRSNREQPVGTLWVDTLGPDERPEVYLQLYNEVEGILDRKHVILTVEVVKREDSQK